MDTAFVLAVAATLAFAFTNGFHDAANAIATLVATRGARPGPAISLAAVCNLLGPLVLELRSLTRSRLLSKYRPRRRLRWSVRQ